MLHFNTVCNLLEELKNTKGNNKKLEILKKGFIKFRDETDFVVQSNFEKFYQGIRLLIPEMDHGRKTYNMKEHKIGRAITKMLSLDGNDKRNLLNYNKPTNNSDSVIDFADIVNSILRKYISTKESSVTVEDINHDLDLIANRASDTELDGVMLQMFRKLTSLEMKWVIRIMLKKLKLGIDNNKILNAFHPDAAAYYSSNSSLQKVCEQLWNSSIKLNELNLTLFEPFQPMLSKRSDVTSFYKDFPENETFFVETKFDGERFQLHMENGTFRYFSRNGFPYTADFGENYHSGSLTQYIKGVFDDHIKNIILDGEMMLWHKKQKKFGSKGMTLDVKKLKFSDKNYQPCFCVFDILLLNSMVLINTELEKRLELLRKTVKQTIVGRLILSEYQETNNRQEIIDILNHSMDNEQEGIVVKKPNSLYKYKDRKGGWYKMKMEYFDDVVTDLDLVLMGGYYKENSNELKSFLVGVISNDEEKSVLSFGKVSSGLNFEELEILNKKFSDKGIFKNDYIVRKEKNLIFGKDIPDILLKPEDSLIFTVRGTELIRCTDESFMTSYTIRFPRILKIRNDKPYQDCLSLINLLELCKKQKAVIKLNKRHLDLEDIPVIKRRKKSRKVLVDAEALMRTSNFLSSLKFFVVTGTKELSIGKIEELIERHGGIFSLHLDSIVHIVIVGEITSKVKNLLKKDNKFDVVKLSWLQRSIDSENLLKYKQDEVLSVGLSYYNRLADDVDKYGDSFTEEIDLGALTSRLNLMAEAENFNYLNNSVVFKADLPLFNHFTGYFDTYEEVNNPSSRMIYDSFLDEIEFRYRLGIVSVALVPSVNLIIIGPGNESRRCFLEEYAMNVGCKCLQVVKNTLLYSEEEL